MKVSSITPTFDVNAVPPLTQRAAVAVGPAAPVQTTPDPTRDEPPLYTPKGRFAPPPAGHLIHDKA